MLANSIIGQIKSQYCIILIVNHISIVIVNYNGDKDTNECLESLAKINTTNFKYDVVVVDNGSSVPYKLPKKLMADNIHVLRSESNLGFTGGNNMGIYQAIEMFNSDYVLLLNNDTLVDENFLRELLVCANKNKEAGLLVSKIYFAKGNEFHKKSYPKSHLGKILWYAGGAIDWQNLITFHRGVDEYDYGQFEDVTESDFATGCSLLIKREVLEKIGLLDKRFFLYLEDVDYSVRAKKAGYKVLFCPDSIIWHKNAGSSGGSGSRVQDYYMTRNLFLFVMKHGGLKQLFIALRLALRYLSFGRPQQRQAVLHAFTNQYGKQTII